MDAKVVIIEPAQSGTLKTNINEIIDLIETHSFTVDFMNWISEGDFIQKIVHDHIFEDRYSRIAQFYVTDILILTLRAEFYLTQMSDEYSYNLIHKRLPFSPDAEFLQIKKSSISKIISEPYYTVISHIYEKEQLCGVSWEIYELPGLSEVYRQKKNRSQYWQDNLSTLEGGELC